MKRQLTFIAFFVLLAISYSQENKIPTVEPIVFVSDTQSPLWIEKLFLDYNDNEAARQLIFDDILGQSASAVFHLGDLVDLGYKDSSWEVIDNFVERLLSLNIPFYPALGNHEIMLMPASGAANFRSRYPDYNKTGYSKQIGDVAVILLNSNFDHLSPEENREQQHWYTNQLKIFQNDPNVSSIIVGCHHPPFTNSKIVSGSDEVHDLFVPEFLNSDKCKLFISGHAHTLEHFIVSGKHFMVIGGAGGLQHPLEEDPEHKDQFQSKLPLRPFHYAKLIPSPQPKVVIRWLNPESAGMEDGYTIDIDKTQPMVSIDR